MLLFKFAHSIAAESSLAAVSSVGRLGRALAIAAALLIGFPGLAGAQTSFSYQGRLVDQGLPADGSYDLLFELYDAQSGGSLIATSAVVEDHPVISGYFVTEIDFGSVFTGAPRWIEVHVREGASTGGFTALLPRQPVTIAPMALIADEALVAGQVPWAGVSGVPVDLAALNAQVAALQSEVDALQSQVDALDGIGQPFLLGRSSQTSNGRFSFGGVSGIAAATEMCRASFTSEPDAHLCTVSELEQALSTGRWSPANQGAMDGVWTWTASVMEESQVANGSLAASCQNLMYNSADTSRGTRVQVDFGYQSPGNGGGVTGNVVAIQSNISCGQNMPVLCCR